MPRDINPALDQALRDLGRPTTPDELRRRGVRRLRSVGMSEISLLIERAVNRTLIESTQRITQPELSDLVRSAQEEFASQLQGLKDLADSRELVERHKREWRQSLESLREVVAQRRGSLETGELDGGPQAAARLLALHKDLEALLRPLAERAGGVEEGGVPQTERVVASIGALLAERLADERKELRQRHDQELSLLERRLEKLVQSLEQTERALDRAASHQAADLGLSSIYREVQGLSPDERARELKALLMASIFEANLALRSHLPEAPLPKPRSDVDATASANS